MSIFPSVTEQDLFKFGKLAEQPKKQRTIKTVNKISRQTHDKILIESFAPITI